MIRTPHRQTTVPHPSCYEESAEPVFGIAFGQRNGSHRFLPYAFLSGVAYDGSGELLLRFTSGTITVRGTSLEPLWKAVCRGELSRVWESDESAPTSGAWVRELILSDVESIPELPSFPQEPSAT